jgi:hypothetical protein
MSMQLSIERHDVQVLTPQFQFNGRLEVMGAVLNFVNDTTRTSLLLHDVHLASLTPDSPLNALSRSQVTLFKSQIVLLHFTEAETRASIRPLVHSELLVAYTPVAVCRGYFHMPAEANVDAFLDVTPGNLLPITEAQVYPLVSLSAPFSLKADLLLMGRSYLQLYHRP